MVIGTIGGARLGQVLFYDPGYYWAHPEKIIAVWEGGLASHGAAIGGVIDGCPAGLDIDLDFIQAELKRRRPGQSAITTQRKEDDYVEFLSGIFEGKSLDVMEFDAGSKGKIEEKLQIAKTMKAGGMPIGDIVKYTGLNSTEIEKL